MVLVFLNDAGEPDFLCPKTDEDWQRARVVWLAWGDRSTKEGGSYIGMFVCLFHSTSGGMGAKGSPLLQKPVGRTDATGLDTCPTHPSEGVHTSGADQWRPQGRRAASSHGHVAARRRLVQMSLERASAAAWRFHRRVGEGAAAPGAQGSTNMGMLCSGWLFSCQCRRELDEAEGFGETEFGVLSLESWTWADPRGWLDRRSWWPGTGSRGAGIDVDGGGCEGCHDASPRSFGIRILMGVGPGPAVLVDFMMLPSRLLVLLFCSWRIRGRGRRRPCHHSHQFPRW